MKTPEEIRNEIAQLERIETSEAHRATHARAGGDCSIPETVRLLRWVLEEAP